jgi:hypothetical protein
MQRAQLRVIELTTVYPITEKGRLHQCASAEHEHAMQCFAGNRRSLPAVM